MVNEDKVLAVAKAMYCLDGRPPVPWDEDLSNHPDWRTVRHSYEAMARVAVKAIEDY